VPDEDGEREIVELRGDDEEWQNHLEELIKRIDREIKIIMKYATNFAYRTVYASPLKALGLRNG
jgi:hypothetical protein